MLHVVLFQPEIPQNTGNVARTCACVGASLHLVRPLGFQLTERNVRRSGMDYFNQVDLTLWASEEEFLATHEAASLFLFTGRTQKSYCDVDYAAAARAGDVFLAFGRESAGINPVLLERWPERCVRIPMLPNRRSLNLANSVAIALYEAQRQLGFPGLG